jgi:F420-dependent oxidoreductase-like protein
VKVGLQIPSFTWPSGPARIGATLGEIARTAEACGFDALAVPDQLWQHPWPGGPGGPEREMLESYSTLAFLAAHTSRVKLLTMVTNPPLRPPALLAKTVTTLDVLSGGRAWLGIGAGHFEQDEAQGLGIAFPPLQDRYEMLTETLQICLRMWDGERGDQRPFAGRHYRLERPLNSPQSLTRPHPPILIGGDGEQKTLRLVARFADACSLRPIPELPHKLDVLRRHCAAEGTDYDAIEKTCVFAFDVGEGGTKAGELVERLRRLSEQGIQTVYGRLANVEQITPLEIMGRDVIPAIATL